MILVDQASQEPAEQCCTKGLNSVLDQVAMVTVAMANHTPMSLALFGIEANGMQSGCLVY